MKCICSGKSKKNMDKAYKYLSCCIIQKNDTYKIDLNSYVH